MRRPISALFACSVLAIPAPAAMAEMTLGLYTAAQSGTSDEASLETSGLVSGARALWWPLETLGVALEFGQVALEDQTDLGLFSLGVFKRFSLATASPYLGASLGISTDQISQNDGSATRQTGPALSWNAGLSYPISPDWSVFGEYNGRYLTTTTEEAFGETLEADVITNAINIGVSFNF